MKNKDIKKKLIAVSLLGSATICSLTGCNYTIFDTKYSFNKALIFGENRVTIVEIKKWTDYDGEQLQIVTEEGLIMVTSSYDTKLIDDRNSDIKAEDIARSIMGEDVEINYINNNGTSMKLTK